MNNYRYVIIDWNYKNGKIIKEGFTKGIKETRKACNQFKLHYSNNAKGYLAYKNNLECLVKKI